MSKKDFKMLAEAFVNADITIGQMEVICRNIQIAYPNFNPTKFKNYIIELENR